MAGDQMIGGQDGKYLRLGLASAIAVSMGSSAPYRSVDQSDGSSDKARRFFLRR